MKKFEYKSISISKGVFASSDKYTEHLTAELNTFGAEGWELVEITGNVALEGYLIFVLKRELEQ